MLRTCRQDHLSVCVGVGLSDCLESVLWQTADCIWMSFGMVSVVVRGMGMVDGVHMPQVEGAVLGFGVPVHPISLNDVFLYATSKL